MHEALSQSEIDALLSGNIKPSASAVETKLTQEESEVLSELCNMSMGRVSDILRSKINKKVIITSPVVQEKGYKVSNDISSELAYAYEVSENALIKDNSYIIFNKADMITVSEALLGGEIQPADPTELNEMQENVFDEVVKDMMIEAFNSMSINLNKELRIGTPKRFNLGESFDNLDNIDKKSKLVYVVYSFQIDELPESKLIQIIPISMAKKMVTFLLNSMGGNSDNTEEEKAPSNNERQNNAPQNNAPKNQVTVKPVAFPSFDDYAPPQYNTDSLNFIMDVPLQLVVELGKTKKTISEILALNVGSIVELDNLAEDHVNILVNGKLVARGEVIVIDENFGVRIMEIFTHNRNSVLGMKK